MLAAGLVPAQDHPTNDQPDPGTPDPQDQTHDAPSLLTRDPSLMDTGGKPLDFSLFAKISAIYDSGLTPLFTPGQPAPFNSPSDSGVEASFGAAVSRRWRRAKLALSYEGAYRHYGSATFFNGLDQFFQLAYSRALQRHLTLDLKTTLGTTTLANGQFTYLPLSTLDRLGLPINDLFDNRTNYSESRADLTWQLSARLSIGIGGEGFIVRRQSLLLAGLNGYTAHANVAYRITSRQTISASYNHTYFDYQNAFGNSRLQIPTLGYSASLTRHWDLSTQAGVARVQATGLTQIALPPDITAITGQTSAIVTFASVTYLPVGEARLIRTFQTSSLALDYSMGVTPGNGYYLTSRQTAAAINYSYISGRNWEARGNLSFNQLSPLGQPFGKFRNFQGGAEVFYNLTRAAHLDVRYDYRHYATENSILQKDSNRVSLGVAFSLGETFRALR